MKKLVLLFLGATAVLAFVPRWVGAAPLPPCPGAPDSLFLTPTQAFVDGGEVYRSATTGRFTTDGGFAFDVETVTATAIEGPPDVGGCIAPSTSLTVTLIDPFSGAAHTLGLNQVSR